MTSKSKSSKTDSKTLSFEESLDRLESIVTALEEGELSLDDSLNQFEEGMKLAKTCELALGDAESRVEKIMKNFSNEKQIEDFDIHSDKENF